MEILQKKHLTPSQKRRIGIQKMIAEKYSKLREEGASKTAAREILKQEFGLCYTTIVKLTKMI